MKSIYLVWIFLINPIKCFEQTFSNVWTDTVRRNTKHNCKKANHLTKLKACAGAAREFIFEIAIEDKENTSPSFQNHRRSIFHH